MVERKGKQAGGAGRRSHLLQSPRRRHQRNFPEKLCDLRRREFFQNQSSLIRMLFQKITRQQPVGVHALSLVINTDATSLKSFAGTSTRPSGPSRMTDVGVISAMRPWTSRILTV